MTSFVLWLQEYKPCLSGETEKTLKIEEGFEKKEKRFICGWMKKKLKTPFKENSSAQSKLPSANILFLSISAPETDDKKQGVWHSKILKLFSLHRLSAYLQCFCFEFSLTFFVVVLSWSEKCLTWEFVVFNSRKKLCNFSD